jgi:hypothetical protein
MMMMQTMDSSSDMHYNFVEPHSEDLIIAGDIDALEKRLRMCRNHTPPLLPNLTRYLSFAAYYHQPQILSLLRTELLDAVEKGREDQKDVKIAVDRALEIAKMQYNTLCPGGNNNPNWERTQTTANAQQCWSILNRWQMTIAFP